jgi:DNA-binding beta-propeller fold protein YncE
VIDPRGIGFDDLVFANGYVAVPAGSTGNLVLIDPSSRLVQTLHIVVFSNAPEYVPGRHDIGVTSAAPGWVATDRSTKTLMAGGLGVHLASEPDYVRAVGRELWVTEPDEAQIEVFTPMPFQHVRTFAVPGGPESLVVSPERNTAYSNLWHGKTVEIDISKHAIVRTFDTGCVRSRGIALDERGAGLFVACNEGRIVRVDLTSGKVAAEGKAGDGVDIIDFSPKTGHLYVPAARAGTLTVFDAKLAVVKTVPVPKGAHCVVADDRGQAWVCDPDHGSLVVFSENP